MKIENIKEVCSDLHIDTKVPEQHIRVLVTADHNDANYVREESIIYFEEYQLPTILAGLGALSKISSFDEVAAMSEKDKSALWAWSNLDLDEDEKSSLEEYSFTDDECLSSYIPYSEDGCCCCDDTDINGCHSIESVEVSIVDEDGKIIHLNLG